VPYDLVARLAAGVRLMRDTRGLTQEQLASKANIETQTLGRIEREEENACLDTIEKLCHAFETDLPLLLAPLATDDPADRPVLIDGRYLNTLKERIQRLQESVDEIETTPASSNLPYPPIKRRRRRSPEAPMAASETTPEVTPEASLEQGDETE
jgi:transcriptional regulator with XRE-family HTH domain